MVFRILKIRPNRNLLFKLVDLLTFFSSFFVFFISIIISGLNNIGLVAFFASLRLRKSFCARVCALTGKGT